MITLHRSLAIAKSLDGKRRDGEKEFADNDEIAFVHDVVEH